MAASDIPGETKESYLKQLNSIVSHGFTTLGIALGSKLGLFSVLADEEGPITIDELADRSKCKPRYVKEWLGQMVVSGLVETNEAGDCFQLPEQGRAAFKSPQCEAAWAPFVIYLSEAHDELLKCFTRDGPLGIPFEHVRRLLDEFMATRPKAIEAFMRTAIQQTSGLEQALEAGAMVCNIGCNHGLLEFLLSSWYPNATFVGVDICEYAIAEAKSKVAAQNTKNVEFHEMDACSLPDDWSSKFDYVTLIITLHDIPHASTCLKEVHRILKPGGWVSINEFLPTDNPRKLLQDPPYRHLANMLYAISLHHCLPQSTVVEGSEGLGTCVGIDQIESLLRGAGFDEVSTSRVKVKSSVDLIHIMSCKQAIPKTDPK